ncbi:MAG: hypothetical protein ACRD8O_02695 [Bryobacteraceae bacterium]
MDNPRTIPESQEPAPEDEPMLYCPICAQRLAGRQCKLVCPRCGYFMSCEDYY